MHQGSIFSFSSDDQFERAPQQNQSQQNRRSDKLRVQQRGFEAAAGLPLVPIEEEEVAAIYGAPAAGGSSNNNMLSEMFNYAGPADVLATAAAPAGYHRLIQQMRPDGVVMSGAATPNIMNTNNWSSSVVHEDLVAAKRHGASDSSSSSSTAMRLFFMNPPSAAAMQHHQRTSTALLHHHDESQAFLGGGAGGSIFGESMSFGGGMRESQSGPSLSLSSSSQGSAAAFLFYNSQQQQEQQLHQAQGPYQQLQMSSSSTYASMSTANVLRNSKYARAAQELLEEFCSVSRGHVGIRNSTVNPTNLSQPGGAASSSSPFSPADRFENQRRKSKLLSMLDEVERRYNHYCEQMQMVVNSFDSVMGFGAAMPYTSLARKAMSRHFRCLKDAIAAQLKQTCELLGDNDGGSASGITKGETPKLRLIDQTLRQQRAFHQMGMIEQEAWRPQRGLPDRSVTILRSWLFEHFLHPYPSDADKHLLARKTGLSRNQVSNWFINARVRLWKPMVEDMYQQEAKEEEDSQLNEDHTAQQQLQPHSPESHDQPPPSAPTHDHAASNSLIFPPPALDDEMYRRAAAAAAARTGDLSLTLGLRHAGGNAPETGGRFGL